MYILVQFLHKTSCTFPCMCTHSLAAAKTGLTHPRSALLSPVSWADTPRLPACAAPCCAGADGYRQFTEAIRRAFHLPDDSELNITFTCDEPSSGWWGGWVGFGGGGLLFLWFFLGGGSQDGGGCDEPSSGW